MRYAQLIMAKCNIIPIFIPFYGCPVKCIYCEQSRITGVSGYLSEECVAQIIRCALEKQSDRPVEVAFYGGTFTMLSVGEQTALLSGVAPFLREGSVQSIRLSTRPEKLDSEDFLRLQSQGVRTIEFGIQSVDRAVLDLAKRGIEVCEMERVVHLAKKMGMSVGLQQMIGLPGDSFEKDMKTARWILDRGDFARIYPTVVFEGTELYTMYREKIYQPLLLKDAIDRVARLLDLYDEADIPVIRVGLPHMERHQYVAGPYHDNFREFAETHRLLRRLKDRYASLVSVEGSPKMINRLAGPFGYGRKALEKIYGPIVFRYKDVGESPLIIQGEEKDIHALDRNGALRL